MAQDNQVETASGKRQRHVHHARASFKAGPVRASAKVSITSTGLLAIGALVSGIILSIAPLVWVATGPARRRAENGETRPRR